MTLIEKAYRFAQEAHKGQFRDDGKTPYITHVKRVASMVNLFSAGNPEMVSAAYLHDTKEDCGIDTKTIEIEFGFHVAYLVEMLTNLPIPKNETEEEAASRRDFDNRRIANASDQVWLIKLCDRLDNLNDISSWDAKRINKYIKKTEILLFLIKTNLDKNSETDQGLYSAPVEVLIASIEEIIHDKYTSKSKL